MTQLRENEQRTLLALKTLKGRGEVDRIAEVSDLAHAAVMRATLVLAKKNLVKVRERKKRWITLNEEGISHAQNGLPERRLISALIKLGGEAPVDDVMDVVETCPGFFASFSTMASGFSTVSPIVTLVGRPNGGRIFVLASRPLDTCDIPK